MENILEKILQIETESGSMELSYMLYPMPTMRGTQSYGILVRNKTLGESEMISDITENLSKAVHLFEQLIRCQVTTVTLRDVVEDFVAELDS